MAALGAVKAGIAMGKDLQSLGKDLGRIWDAVDQVNTKLREASRLGNIDQKLMALDTASQNIAGMTGDYLSYKASGDLARATGDMGIFERQRLRQLLKGQINPTTGKPYTDPDIAEIFNISINEPVATNTTTNENEG